MAGTRVHDDHGAFAFTNNHAFRRDDPGKFVIDGTLQILAVHDNLIIERQHRGLAVSHMVEIHISPFAHDVPKQDLALSEVDKIILCLFEKRIQ